MVVHFTEFIPTEQAAIDGPWRVESYKAAFHPLKVNRFPYKLHLYSHSSYGIYGSREEIYKILHRFNPHRRGDLFKSMNFMVFEHDKTTIKELTKFRDGSKFNVLSGRTFLEGLETLEKYFSILHKELDKYDVIRPMNKKYDVIPVFITGNELIDPDVSERITLLLKDGQRLRVQLLFLSENPDLIPESVEEFISWQLFLGKSNIDYAKNIYDLNIVHKNHNKVQAGVILDKEHTPEYLLFAFDYDAEDTEYLKKVIFAEKEEKENYLDFLESLVSGDD